MTFDHKSLALLREALESLDQGFGHLPDISTIYDIDKLRNALLSTAERLRDNYPYHHPFYVGQMLKPPHPVARLAYALAMWINPNNHALEKELTKGETGTVVVTLGTTAAGTVDRLQEILALRKKYDFRIHVDAAYGGYFILADNLSAETREAFDHIGEADSIVIDPHKHGLQPYGCGCVLFRDPSVGKFYQHNSPYTYFTSSELHLGEISLECSRPGASAVALWTTLRLLPLERGGEFARGLEAGREAALMLHDALEKDERFAPLFPPELDIVTWVVIARTASESSMVARKIFEAAAQHDLHFALASFPKIMLESCAPVSKWDADEITCLRACVMKPEHREWMPEILSRFRSAVEDDSN